MLEQYHKGFILHKGLYKTEEKTVNHNETLLLPMRLMHEKSSSITIFSNLYQRKKQEIFLLHSVFLSGERKYKRRERKHRG